jgi:hypothetical protein
LCANTQASAPVGNALDEGRLWGRLGALDERYYITPWVSEP